MAGRELPRSPLLPTASPPQQRPRSAAYRRWGAHPAAPPGREEGAGGVGVPARGAPRRRRSTRLKASWAEAAPQPICRPGWGKARGPPAPAAAQLGTARAGSPGPGSAEPAPLPSDSPRGAHADARDEPGCGSRGEGWEGQGEGGREAAARAPPSASPPALGRGHRGGRDSAGRAGEGARWGAADVGGAETLLLPHWGCSSRWRRRGGLRSSAPARARRGWQWARGCVWHVATHVAYMGT